MASQPPLPVVEAQARLFAMAQRASSESVPLAAAAGRWLAEPLVALRSQPASDVSAMDGYALRFADMPGPWSVVGESAAGRFFHGVLGAGEATRIFTGASMPEGADTVLIQEEASCDHKVLMLAGKGPAKKGANVRRKALDFSRGQTLISAGERLTPARLALAATAGHGRLLVNRRLRVALLATGDELIDPADASSNPSALPEGNCAMVAAMLADLPVDIEPLGIVADTLDALSRVLSATRADIIVTTGGASVGAYDFVRPALIAAGGSINFWRIALRPGKPMLAGRLGDALVLGLPGNPVSAFVTATLFLRPLIATMAGAAHPMPTTFQAVLGETLPRNDHRQDYLRAILDDGKITVASIQDSSMLAPLANANCLVIRTPHAPEAHLGDTVEIIPIA